MSAGGAAGGRGDTGRDLLMCSRVSCASDSNLLRRAEMETRWWCPSSGGLAGSAPFPLPLLLPLSGLTMVSTPGVASREPGGRRVCGVLIVRVEYASVERIAAPRVMVTAVQCSAQCERSTPHPIECGVADTYVRVSGGSMLELSCAVQCS